MIKQREVPPLPDQIRIALYHPLRGSRKKTMASNEPAGDNRRIGAVRKRTQLKGKLRGKTAWTKRDKTDGKFMAVKKSKKKFKGVRRENKAA